MSETDIAGNLIRVRAAVAAAAKAAGREVGEVCLVAVSKRKSIEAIRDAYAAGQRDFGENRLQELVEKRAALPADVRWHMIGHLQSNKVKVAVANSDLIHSVDTSKLLQRVDRIAGELGKIQPILLQGNVSGEESKFGQSVDELVLLTEEALGCENIRLRGYMTMAPWDASEGQLLTVFSGLRDLRDAMQDKHAVSLPELSMGMSGDYAQAIACGATYVRIGTAIFGERQY